MTKKILIVGSNGFISQNLIKFLIPKYQVYGMGTSINRNKNIQNYYRCDISDSNKVKKIVNNIQPDIIINLAVNLNRNNEKINESINTNVMGTLNILQATTTIKRYIFFDTCESYIGKPPYKESDSLMPKSPYSLSKIQASYLISYFQNQGYPITILRPSIVYGPKQKKGMFIPSIITSLIKNKKFTMTKGEQTRDFVYVDDVCQAVVKAINDDCNGIFNIASGKEIRIIDMARKITKLLDLDDSVLNLSLDYRNNELMEYSLDISKAKEKLKWEPQTNMDDGLSKTINWYENEK